MTGWSEALMEAHGGVTVQAPRQSMVRVRSRVNGGDVQWMAPPQPSLVPQEAECGATTSLL